MTVNLTKRNDKGNREKLRRCLLCGEAFESLWAGNRICKRCRSSAIWKQGC